MSPITAVVGCLLLSIGHAFVQNGATVDTETTNQSQSAVVLMQTLARLKPPRIEPNDKETIATGQQCFTSLSN
eukprot:Skav224000  [mRNA]  locus=scaffold2619:21337:22008:- [translate_table: standard]